MIVKFLERDRTFLVGIVVAAIAAVSAVAFAVYGWFEFQRYQKDHVLERRTLEKARAVEIGANQDVAEWSYSLLVVGVAGSLLSAAGIAVVALTLRETRLATETTREIGQNQTKAYVRAISARLFKHDAVTVAVEIKYLNEGETPAVAVRDLVMIGYASLPLLHEGATYTNPPRTWHRRSAMSPRSEQPIVARSLLPDYPEVATRIAAGKQGANALAHPWFILRGVVLYRDVFGKQYRTEYIFTANDLLTSGSLELNQIDADIPHYQQDDREDPPIIDSHT